MALEMIGIGAYMQSEELALNGGPKAKKKQFPEWPNYSDLEVAAASRVIESRRWWRIAGTEVSQFEGEFARYQGALFALALTNGTVALEVLLAALDIGRGDEVVVPAFTFISTATAVLCGNAVPILADISPDTYCLDPASLEAAITPSTRAVIPVHMAGHVADMDAISAIARKHNILVIEDCAHAQGAEWKKQSVGALGVGSIFSFQAGKLMTAGEGGLVLSNDEDLIERCFLYGNCGRPKLDTTYQHALLGTNGRMSELHAAVLRAQLTRLDEQIRVREENTPGLNALLKEIEGIVPQGSDPRTTRNPHYMYMFSYDAEAFGGLPRQQFVAMLNAEGVPAFVGYPAIHRLPVFRNRAFGPRWRPDDPFLPDYNKVSCPIAEQLGESLVWLHHRVLLGDHQDLVEIAGAIRKIRNHARTSVTLVAQ